MMREKRAQIPKPNRRLAGEMDIIAQMGRLISSTLDIDEVYEAFALLARKLIPFDRLAVNLFNPQENEMAVSYVYGMDVAGRERGKSFPRAGSMSDVLIKTRAGLLLHPATLEEIAGLYPGLVYDFQAGIRSLMSVPLIYRDEVIGALHFRSKKANLYTEQNLRLAEKIGAQIAGDIAHAQLFARLKEAQEENERRSKQLTGLYETSIELTAELNLNQLLQALVQRAIKLIGGAASDCFIYRQEVDLLERVAQAGPQMIPGGPTRKRGEGFAGHIWKTGDPQIVNDYRSWSGRITGFDDFPSPAMVGAPIRWGEEFLGVLNVMAYLPHRYTPEDMEVVSMLAAQAAIAIRNARLYNLVEQLSVTDELTGLFNRRGFFQLAAREFERAMRFGRHLTALMIDIDHFKQVNDSYGHSTGDKVLRTLADGLRLNSRGIDVAGRYGGEEFVLLLPEISLPESLVIAERLRQAMADRSLPVSSLHDPPGADAFLRITVSVGVADLGRDVTSLDNLLNRADGALYRAKDSGRNCVVAWEDKAL